MNNHESLKKIISVMNTGVKYPAVNLVKTNPELAALMSKLVKPKEVNTFDISNPNSYYNLNQSQLQSVSDSIKSRIKDNENIVQLFPDIELAIQILVSSILSPKDMIKTDIIYKTKESIFPSELTLKLNTIVQTHLEGHYKIKDDLQNILRETLFDSGSCIKAVLPESVVDEIINYNKAVSTESLSELFSEDNKTKHLGILGNSGINKTRTALERFSEGITKIEYESQLNVHDDPKLRTALKGLIEVTDNYKLLKLPKVVEAYNKSKLKKIIAVESGRMSQTELSSLVYKDTKVETETFMIVPTPANAKRKSVGRPLVLKLPSESVIPIYIPGDETKHIGYFVLTDADGNPVTVNSINDNADGLSGLAGGQGQNQSLSSLLIQKAKRNLVNSSNSEPTMDHITKVYSSIIEKDLIDRLKNGLYGTGAAIGNNEEIYRIMLARSLASKYTRLIFIPGELVTYYAFKFFNNGVGKSYLDDLKILTSLRAILLFSKVMAMTKNSIALTHVNVTLDPNDPDPQKTLEIASHEIVKMRQQYFPLGINSPVDLVDWIQRAGLEFSIEGHPGLPTTKFDFETKNLQHALPDSDLDEMLRKQTYMALGLSPEVVDNGFNSEFATTVISNNILLSKRIVQLQDIFTRLMTDNAQKIITNDSFIINELIEALNANAGTVEKFLSDEEKEAFNEDKTSFMKDLIERYIENVELDLPKPDITSIETQISAFDQYVESLDKTLDAWLSSDILSNDLAGEINGNIDSIKAVVRSHYLRQWLSENGFMSELNEIITADEDGSPTIDIYDIQKTHMEGLVRSSVKFIASLKEIRDAANKDLENMGVEEGDMTADDSTDTEDTAGDDFGADDFGMDDIGGDTVEEDQTDEPADEESATEDDQTDETNAVE